MGRGACVLMFVRMIAGFEDIRACCITITALAVHLFSSSSRCFHYIYESYGSGNFIPGYGMSGSSTLEHDLHLIAIFRLSGSIGYFSV